MKQKIRIVVSVLLVLAAIGIAVYNFTEEKQIACMASIVAVVGTVVILVKEIYVLKKKKSE